MGDVFKLHIYGTTKTALDRAVFKRAHIRNKDATVALDNRRNIPGYKPWTWELPEDLLYDQLVTKMDLTRSGKLSATSFRTISDLNIEHRVL